MSVKIALLCLLVVCLAIDMTSACACPRVYWPVCGSDGVTYSNLQCMKCQKPNLRVTKLGPCKVVNPTV
ncbi:unnamed protein product [Parnassius apollo]|uniref:(apollo) hypothetical protein n=1 Tax=Parnassius apollo TaxID=110799 RepID=A0A8S3W636_PARAO|nr:unnamed protein product [Parnassius apollo]